MGQACSEALVYCKRVQTCPNREKSFPALVLPTRLLVCSVLRTRLAIGACLKYFAIQWGRPAA